MTVRSSAVVLALVGAACCPAGTAAAAPTPCPPAFLRVDEAALRAELVAKGAPAEALAGLHAVVVRVDRNGNGRICQQVGSYGRAPGQPSFFSNFRDDRTVR